MPAQGLIKQRQVGRNTHGGGLLPDAQVNGCPHLLLGVFSGNLFLDPTNPEHLKVQGKGLWHSAE
jgi:hypothetical protein